MRRALSSHNFREYMGVIGAVSDWRFPKADGKENEVYDQNNWQTDTVPSRTSSGSSRSVILTKPSSTPRNIRVQSPSRHRSLLDRRVEGANQVPPRSIQKAAPARLMHRATSHNCHQNECIVPKVREGDDEVDEQDWQTDTMSSHISSGRNHSAHLVKPRNIRLQIPRLPSLLDRRVDRINRVMCQACSSDNYHQHVGALDGINEWRLPMGCVVTTKCLRQSSSTASNSSKSAPGTFGKVKEKAAIVRSAHTSGGSGTLGTGGGYGDPHPPPFYKCEVCRKGTAFYRLKCCRLVVCECCGCACEPADAEEDKKLQSQRGKMLAGNKEKLPKVKLEGSDLFLWQPCSFPAGLMLCMAKRTGNHLQYYFAPVDELMNPEVRVIRATVYDFRQHGRNAKSLSVRNELLTHKQLH